MKQQKQNVTRECSAHYGGFSIVLAIESEKRVALAYELTTRMLTKLSLLFYERVYSLRIVDRGAVGAYKSTRKPRSGSHA
jgi:hypothetical protein